MATQVKYVKDGQVGVFSDRSIQLANPEKKGWKKLEATAAQVPDKTKEFLNHKKEVTNADSKQTKQPEKGSNSGRVAKNEGPRNDAGLDGAGKGPGAGNPGKDKGVSEKGNAATNPGAGTSAGADKGTGETANSGGKEGPKADPAGVNGTKGKVN